MPTGAALLVDTLVAAGVEHLFTLSGNQILSVYDATIGKPLALYHTRHEASAVHMADAFARLTDRPGVALVTAGPGHLNALGALYGALMEESPVVLLSGASPRGQRGLGAFQEIDQVAAARPVTKAAWVAEDPARLGHDMARALEIAASGRPGPVHLSLPGDVLEASADAVAPAVPGAPVRVATAETEVTRILALLAEAKRPVILAGAGMARGRRWLAVQRLASSVAAPALPSESPRGLNDPWLHGANACLASADLVVLLGKALDFSVRFGRPPGFAAECRFVHVTAEAAPPNARATLTVVGDPATVAEQLASAARGRAWSATGWLDEVPRVRAATPPAWQALRQSARAPMHPLAVCSALQPIVDAGAVLVVDGGEFGQWVQAGVEAPRRLINGPSGSIGSAIPMAIAARLVHPDRAVIAALGDGTFGFHPLELDTALRYALPIVAVVGNDARWNAEHQLQVQHYGAARAVACELLPTRYDRIAEALGGHGEHVDRPGQLPGALARAIASGKPAVVNVVIDGVAAPTFVAGPDMAPHTPQRSSRPGEAGARLDGR